MARNPLRSRASSLHLFLLLAAAVLALATFGEAGCSGRRAQRNAPLLVSAAVSLQESLQEIGPLFQRQRSVEVRFNFGASGSLEQQIEHGAPVDVFLSAAPLEMDRLESQGLIVPGTRHNLVTNELVMVTGTRAPSMAGFDDLLRPDVKRIAMAEPSSVPAGKYAREMLMHLGLWDRLQPKLVFTGDVRQALIDVETGNAEAGLVYDTEARLAPHLKVAASAPTGSHSPVLYPVAVIRGAHGEEARALVDFLLGPEAQAVFVRHGFHKAVGSGQ